ncbi:hypothetical protein L9F63_018423, partial [Diploptera punctata]
RRNIAENRHFLLSRRVRMFEYCVVTNVENIKQSSNEESFIEEALYVIIHFIKILLGMKVELFERWRRKDRRFIFEIQEIRHEIYNKLNLLQKQRCSELLNLI